VIEAIHLKFGATAESPKTTIATTPVTVFVGPNNSGKSKTLSEIQLFCQNGRVDQNFVIIENIDIGKFDSVTAGKEIERIKLKPNFNESVPLSNIIVGNFGGRTQVEKESLLQALTSRDQPYLLEWFCQWYLQYQTIILDGKSRMQLINEQAAGDLLQPPANSLSALFRNDEKRKMFQRIVFDAFGLYPVIDPTNLGTLRIKLSIEKPKPVIERSLTDDVVQFYSHAVNVSQMSDGVKAFTGIILQLIAGDPKIVLVDEPEAFLHPSLAFLLGKEIGEIASRQNKKVFISTHSPNFIMGCLQAGVPINVVRLTYLGGVATSRILSNEKLSVLMRNPLLRSTGVLSGLFYESVIVTESDTDRAFYQEINERLLRFKPEWGIRNCLFLNAQNKQTVSQIIRPLRELGIPASAIVDIDILKEGGTVWSSFLDGGYVPEITKQSLDQSRALLNKKFKELKLDMKRNGGIEQLPSCDRSSAEDLFSQIEEYGLFSLRFGELESWLKLLGVTGHGPKWLIDVFEKMGDNPDDQDYMKPTDADVWQFIYTIRTWLNNPHRKGIPV
jgi:ABC-type cobalamin/Fe3+-siderophores transport system ATPase subunit